MGPDQHNNRWTRLTRDRWFYALLVTALVAVVVLLQPFIYVLGLAVVTVIVTWPLYQCWFRSIVNAAIGRT